MIVRCVFCPSFLHESDTETALKTQRNHRETVHANVKITHRKRYRRGAMQISDKTVQTNIDAVRKEGGAAWVNRVA